MRHRRRTAKLGRTSEHRNAMLANMVCSLIKEGRDGRQGRIKTTLAKAKAARVVADKMITLGKKGQDKDKSIHYRRLAAARLRSPSRTFFEKKGKLSGRERRQAWRAGEDVVHILFDELAPRFKDRNGGYTRVIKIGGYRKGDAAQMAILEWVEAELEAKEESAKPKPEKTESKPAEEKAEESAVEETAVTEDTEEAAEEATAEETAKEETSSEETADEESSEDEPAAEEEKTEADDDDNEAAAGEDKKKEE